MEMPDLEEYCENIRKIYDGIFLLKDSDEARKLISRRPDLKLQIKGTNDYEICPLVLKACKK